MAGVVPLFWDAPASPRRRVFFTFAIPPPLSRVDQFSHALEGPGRHQVAQRKAAGKNPTPTAWKRRYEHLVNAEGPSSDYGWGLHWD